MGIFGSVDRQAEVIGPHAGDLHLRKVTVSEKLGQVTEIELEVLSLDHELRFEDFLSQDMAVRLQLPFHGRRYFHGFVTKFTYDSAVRIEDEDYTLYLVSLRPWLWFLTKPKDCRIFQDMSVPEIVKEVFRNAGFSDFEDRLTDKYRKREYCVQYQEKSHDFALRLMEKEGIYFYFRHEAGKHTLVLCDSPAAHEPAPGYPVVPFKTSAHEGDEAEEAITSWSVAQEFEPDSTAVGDYEFKTPRVDLTATAGGAGGAGGLHFEVYNYHGTHHVQADGERYARIQMEEIDADHERATGESTARGLGAGHIFQLIDHPRLDMNRMYMIVSASHEIRVNQYFTEEDAEEEPVYKCELEAIDNRYTFRPKKDTKKAVVKGPQTATVVGPDGEEIHTDEFGRVKVHFHWDRHQDANEESSCWIRVGQRWAGNNWGGMVIPRIGMEVIVDFLEGDPDEPIITGLVYNDDNEPPYDPTEHGTMSTFKSDSSKGGGGFNEIRFEDKKGDEQIFMHGEKDQDVRIEHDSREWIGNERHLIVESNQHEQVKASKHSIVDEDRLTKVDGDEDLKVGGSRTTKVGGAENLAVGGDLKLKVSGDINVEGSGKRNEKYGQDLNLDIGRAFNVLAKGRWAVDCGSTIYLRTSTAVIIEGPEAVALKCGGNFINITPGGVDIHGTVVKINSGGSLYSSDTPAVPSPASPGSPDAPTAPTEAAEADPGSTPQAPEDPEPPDSTEGPEPSGHTDNATQAAEEGDALTQPGEVQESGLRREDGPADSPTTPPDTGGSEGVQESDLRREEGLDGRSRY
jgi:type VI secretion system secreted protein VgrG